MILTNSALLAPRGWINISESWFHMVVQSIYNYFRRLANHCGANNTTFYSPKYQKLEYSI